MSPEIRGLGFSGLAFAQPFATRRNNYDETRELQNHTTTIAIRTLSPLEEDDDEFTSSSLSDAARIRELSPDLEDDSSQEDSLDSLTELAGFGALGIIPEEEKSESVESDSEDGSWAMSSMIKSPSGQLSPIQEEDEN